MICYIGAIGYGAGYQVPNSFGWHPLICLVCCFALGFVFDTIAKKILFSKFYEASKKNKIIVAVCSYASYLVAWVVINKTLGYDLDNDFLLYLAGVIVIQMVLLIIKAVRNFFVAKKGEKA